jgi:succinoglycan biosynthesis transport protein ExoP
MELWTYYRILRRWRWVIVAAMLAGVVAGTVAYHPGIGDYSATATLLVPAPDTALSSVSGTNAEIGGSQDERANEALSLVWSEEIAQRVINALHLDMNSYQLHQRLAAGRDQTQPLIHISMSGRTPQEAVALTNAMADTVAAYDKNVERQQYTLAREFMERQVEQAQATLRAEQNALLTFETQHDVALESARNAQYVNLQAQAQQADVGLREVEAKLAGTRALLSKESPTRSEPDIVANPVAQDLRTQLAGLEVALTSMLVAHTDAYPGVIALKGQIQAAKDRLATEVGKIVAGERVVNNPVWDALDQSLADLETQKLALLAQKDAIQQVIDQTRRDLPAITRTQAQLAGLNSVVTAQERVLTDLQARLAEARLREQEAQNIGALSVVDHAASAAPNPFHQARFLVTLSLVLGLLLGAGLAFLLEYLDNSLKTPERAERLLGTPALAAIPRHNPPYEEAYRLLRTNLTALEPIDGAHVVAFTGIKPGGGTSTVIGNLGQAFARAGRRTIIVDAALHHPDQHVRFKVPNNKGLVEVLTGRATLPEVLAQTEIRNLQVVPGGDVQTTEADGILGSPAMGDLLAGLRQRGDVILLDTPPAGMFADAFDVAPLASGVVLVLDARQVPRGAEEQVKTQLDRVGARLLGTVLTRVRPDLVSSYVYREMQKLGERKLSTAGAATAAFLLLAALGFLAAMLAHSVHLGGTSLWVGGGMTHAVTEWISALRLR